VNHTIAQSAFYLHTYLLTYLLSSRCLIDKHNDGSTPQGDEIWSSLRTCFGISADYEHDGIISSGWRLNPKIDILLHSNL